VRGKERRKAKEKIRKGKRRGSPIHISGYTLLTGKHAHVCLETYKLHLHDLERATQKVVAMLHD